MPTKKNIKIKVPSQQPKFSQIPIKRSLHYKILFVMVPLFLISFTFFGITSYFSINKSITNIAKEFIGYRLKEVAEFASNLQINIGTNETEISIYNNRILSYAQKFANETFLIIPYTLETNKEAVYTFNTNISDTDIQTLYKIMHDQENIKNTDADAYNSWLEIQTTHSDEMVGIFLPYTTTQSWFLLLADKNQFYQPVRETIAYLILIVIISLIILITLVILFVNTVISPLNNCVNTIKSITDSMDFSKRVRIFYPDEIGILGQYFNNMIQELEKSYNKIKNYAYQTVLAKQKEERIRFIFQKYVPTDVIDYVLNRTTDTMLIGNKQVVSVLFSDIRDFTTISEQISPEELVISLNTYFTGMVKQVIDNNGIIDKFIGDAIMAIFGAPATSKTFADDAVQAALLMTKEIDVFNKRQKEQGRIQFEMGIGINTGEAIVGNIGSEQKLDYTVIGDTVNLGARLEGLTKFYKQPILISEFTKKAMIDTTSYLFLNVDTVRVKGKKAPVIIYTPILKKSTPSIHLQLYQQFHLAQQHYYYGDFHKALELFKKLESQKDHLYLIELYIERCEYLILNPPTNWEGVETWKTK